jgi:hypothetical protein
MDETDDERWTRIIYDISNATTFKRSPLVQKDLFFLMDYVHAFSTARFYNRSEYMRLFEQEKKRFFKNTPLLLRIVAYSELSSHFDWRDACVQYMVDKEGYERTIGESMYLETLVAYLQSFSSGTKTQARIRALETHLWALFKGHVVLNHPEFTASELANGKLVKELLVHKCKGWKNFYRFDDTDAMITNIQQRDPRQDNICQIHNEYTNR